MGEWLYNTFLNNELYGVDPKEAIKYSFYKFDNATKTIQRNDDVVFELARQGLLEFEMNMAERVGCNDTDSDGPAGNKTSNSTNSTSSTSRFCKKFKVVKGPQNKTKGA